MTPGAAVQSILRAIPRQRRSLRAYTFHVVPTSGAAFEIELWSAELVDATDKATRLAVQAYGADTTITLAS